MGVGIESISKPTLKHTSGRYVRLATFDSSVSEGLAQDSIDGTNQGCCCVRLTKFRLITLLVVSLITVIMVLYTSIIPSVSQTSSSLEEPKLEMASPEAIPDWALQHSLETGHIRYKHTKRRLPYCLIIGARKAGTRALLTFLDLHPQIRTAKNEVHFFDNDESYARGLEFYRKRMPYSFPGQVTLEKTPAYFTVKHVPERVYKMNSTIKLLLIVRDPVDRAISDYLQVHLNKVAKNKTDKTFEEHAIDEYGNVIASFNPIVRSLYFKYMTFWLRYFSVDQFLILNGASLIYDPYTQVKRVEKFLGLESKISKDMFFYNETKGFYCIRNEFREKCLVDSKGRTHPEISPLVIQKLRDFFRPYNMRFYQLVGVDFGWS